MDKFMEELITELKDVMDESYSPVLVKARKNNEQVYNGIRFDQKGECVSPIIYVDELYQEYQSDRISMVDVVTLILDKLKEKEDVGKIVKEIQQYEMSKSKLKVALLNYSANQEVLKERVHKPFLDLAIVPFVDVITEGGIDGSIFVTENLVQMWGVDKEMILEQGIQNMIDKERFFIASLDDILKGFMSYMAEEGMEVPDAKGGVYVISNEKKQYGAKIMLNPDFLHKVAIKHNSNLIIYPSSTHEIIVMVEEEHSGHVLRAEDIQLINEEGVRREEQLSNSVYYYDRERKEVSIREVGKPLCEGME